ncbi:MAG: TOBE domain-containing protein, partial [Agrobacterium sp.]|uniref:TOBE domain-containing protein n=1 Tax=Agrobacterium sp. TaxID=361 RepID=UPI004034BAAB
RIPLPARYAGAAREGAPVVIGIRPEALRAATSAATDLSLPVEIEVVELTGPELVTTARLGTQRLTACLPPRASLAKGDKRDLAFDEAALRLFDPSTGKALPTA